MSKVVKGIFGGRVSKKTKQLQREALESQKRSANAALEDGAIVRAEQAASGRRLRGLGRRALAFAGNELGVTGSLAVGG